MISIPVDSVKIRAFNKETDTNFIYSTWLKKYKFTSYFAKRIKIAIFYRGHQKVVDHILQKPSVVVLVASLKEDPNIILGYLVYEPATEMGSAVIHFMCVKDIFQKMGIGRSLIEASNISLEGTRFSHWTMPMDELYEKYPGLIYDPYAF